MRRPKTILTKKQVQVKAQDDQDQQIYNRLLASGKASREGRIEQSLTDYNNLCIRYQPQHKLPVSLYLSNRCYFERLLDLCDQHKVDPSVWMRIIFKALAKHAITVWPAMLVSANARRCYVESLQDVVGKVKADVEAAATRHANVYSDDKAKLERILDDAYYIFHRLSFRSKGLLAIARALPGVLHKAFFLVSEEVEQALLDGTLDNEELLAYYKRLRSNSVLWEEVLACRRTFGHELRSHTS